MTHTDRSPLSLHSNRIFIISTFGESHDHLVKKYVQEVVFRERDSQPSMPEKGLRKTATLRVTVEHWIHEVLEELSLVLTISILCDHHILE